MTSNCPHCAAEQPPDGRFCSRCGQPMGAEPAGKSEFRRPGGLGTMDEFFEGAEPAGESEFRGPGGLGTMDEFFEGAKPAGEPEFRRWRRRVNRRLTILCAIAIPAGLLFLGTNPGTTLIVSGLGGLGLIVGLLRLSRLAEP